MGTASKVCSLILRTGELISAAIVAGILGWYLHLLDIANADASSRVVYTVAIAGISIVASLVLFPPLKYSFYCFILDFILCICWAVAFGLLCNLTVSGGCYSHWYWYSWGYYWGRYWYIPHNTISQSIVGTAACAEWRATLAFTFIGGVCWFTSGLLGVYVSTKSPEETWATNGADMDHASKPSKLSRWRHNEKHPQAEVEAANGTSGATAYPAANQA